MPHQLSDRDIYQEVLHESSRKLRDVVSTVTPGPWTVAGPYESGAIYVANDEIGVPVAKFDKPRRDENVHYVAMMNPDVALAVADLFDAAAFALDNVPDDALIDIVEKAYQAAETILEASGS